MTEFRAAWRAHRAYLINLAYQLLDDVGDAEDVVQEAFLRLSRTDGVDDPRGWLTVVTSRLCLDVLRSARARHETTRPLDLEVAAGPDPVDRVTLDDEVRHALFEVLRRLTPGERVAFVLHDVFGVPFDDVATTMGRPVGTCRQLARRARAKCASASPRGNDVAPLDHQRVTSGFITACANGDTQALIALLDPTVWGSATVLADPAAPRVNHGPLDVAENLLRHVGPGCTIVAGPPGQPALLAFDRGRLFAVVVLTMRGSRIVKIEATADPSARFPSRQP